MGRSFLSHAEGAAINAVLAAADHNVSFSSGGCCTKALQLSRRLTLPSLQRLLQARRRRCSRAICTRVHIDGSDRAIESGRLCRAGRKNIDEGNVTRRAV